MLTLSNTVLLFGSWELEGDDTLRIIVFASVIAIMTISGIGIWAIPVIDAYAKGMTEELPEEEEE